MHPSPRRIAAAAWSPCSGSPVAADRQGPRSALALELTPSHARALLLERAEGRSRVTATGEAITSADGPSADAAVSARAAIGRVEAAVGRTIYELGGLGGPRGGDGPRIDVAALVVDARPRVTLVALGDKPAAASAVRALAQIDAEHGEPLVVDGATDPTRLADAIGGRAARVHGSTSSPTHG